MRQLFQFFVRYSVFFLFLLLEIGSFTMVLHSSDFRRNAYFSSANVVVSGLYQMSNSVVEFFKLKSTNANLSDENAMLQNRITDLENKLAMMHEEQAGIQPIFTPAENQVEYIAAKVINSSTNKQKNYITINKGARNGIRPDMGVVSSDGAVGVVKSVSDKFAVIIPILNPEFKLNSKFKASNYAGPLVWHGTDYRYANLEDIARHVNVHKGDTLVTSGLTTIFPEGVPVGIVHRCTLKESDSYYDIQVELAVNFRKLSYVQVIKNNNFAEQKALEEAAETENGNVSKTN